MDSVTGAERTQSGWRMSRANFTLSKFYGAMGMTEWLEWLSLSYLNLLWREAAGEADAPLRPECPPEMFSTSNGVAFRAPSLGAFPGMSNWEGTGRRPRSHCWDCVSGKNLPEDPPSGADEHRLGVVGGNVNLDERTHLGPRWAFSNASTCLGSLLHSFLCLGYHHGSQDLVWFWLICRFVQYWQGSKLKACTLSELASLNQVKGRMWGRGCSLPSTNFFRE